MTASPATEGNRIAALFEPGGAKRIVPMEGVRGVAILLVFLVHHATLFGPWAGEGWTREWARFIHTAGQVGVDIFFALSGYLVYSLAIGGRRGTGEFIVRRMQRIYPPFLAVMALYLGLLAAMPGRAKWAEGEAWGFILASLALLPGIFELDAVVTVAWSLSYEMAFYLSLPVLAAVLGLKRWPRGRRAALVGGLAVGYAVCALVWFPGNVGAIRLSVWNHPRMLLFAAGVLTWEWMEARRAARGEIRVGMGGSVAAAGVLGLAVAATYPLSHEVLQQPWPSLARAALLGVGCFLVFRASFGGESALGRALSWRPLRWLGNMSYSFYLVHALGIQACAMAAQRVWAEGAMPGLFWMALPVAMAASVGVSLPVYLFVERPYSLRRPALRA